MKYLSRAEEKENTLQDLEKALWYLNRLIREMKEETANLYNGSLELHEALAGQETGVTHFVVARAKSMADWITGRNNIFASDAFQNFSSSVRNISEVLDIHSARVVKQYNVN
mgnify:CR=1 FL=1